MLVAVIFLVVESILLLSFYLTVVELLLYFLMRPVEVFESFTRILLPDG